ncbi:MAG: DegT/DnrJ/EryC1/StrS family aminotransferase [Tannerella sp.]|jgi:dTDP-4-amino-4,6-dideoxygalactose transaminase|nr:DegT/DnrJ/EryC1/StrS family aminotransferase [Tannerella sp.]
MQIQMVDLVGQYRRYQTEIDDALRGVLTNGRYINGPEVGSFASHLSAYLGGTHVIPCGNGTDALQIALMGLGLKPGDEVIVPAFTYAAAVEAAILLGLTPVVVDVDYDSFNILPEAVEAAVSKRTRALIAVHLFGQCCDMSPLLDTARRHGLRLIEDKAQSLGAAYTFPDGRQVPAGTMGDIGILSFFPTKILGGYGDGGALLTADEALAERLRQLTVHGQSEKYRHRLIGCNSRLDSLQAAVLDAKLPHIGAFIEARQAAAAVYDRLIRAEGLRIPFRLPASTHVFHQYTLRVSGGQRDALKGRLQEAGIPSAVYYPLSIDRQEAYRSRIRIAGSLENAHRLTEEVLSIPIHTEMDDELPAQIATYINTK